MMRLIAQAHSGERVEIGVLAFGPMGGVSPREHMRQFAKVILEEAWDDTTEVWFDDECTICGGIHSEDNCPKVAAARTEQPE